jgi:hypothetical protein
MHFVIYYRVGVGYPSITVIPPKPEAGLDFECEWPERLEAEIDS